MPNTNLIVAFVFAALFGSALLYLAIYFIHEYIHRRCLELDHWLRRITPPQWRRPCRHCEGTGLGLDVKEKSRSRSKGRSRSRGRKERSRGRRGDVRMIEAGTEWSDEGMVQRPRQVLPASPMIRGGGMEEQYNPWQDWQGQNGGAQQMGIGYPQGGAQQMGIAYPQAPVFPHVHAQMHPQMCQQPFPQAQQFMMPVPVPQQQDPCVAMPIPASVSSMPTYHKPHKAYTALFEQSQRAAQPKPKAKAKRVHKVQETDFIHFVDDYPPIIKESLKKKAAQQPTSGTSSSSSTSTEPAEEVPRTSIPQGTPRFAEPAAFQFPQYPVTWNAPTSYPRQWDANAGGGGRANEQARYASPYTRPEGRVSRESDVERRRQGPSNSFETTRCRASQRRDNLQDVGRRRSVAERRQRRGRNQNGESGADDILRKESDRPRSSVGSPKEKPPKVKTCADQPSSYERVPNMSPMPQPIVEEPASEGGSGDGRGVSASSKIRPMAPSMSSPMLDVRSLSRSPLSAASSLQ
ncbi:hypothetical protein CC86DRAFT_411008 [Ophiobolus disseminans]|uniref:Uncharacterized protein n=1 Tax=Ophiobolus disseminans TaxID=1469910 RepID=A0A6A6ZJU8_9PLEO|nr:hypothetical protein CC86DRAFT_411008 [Ophiobolus disseminans]